MSGVIQKDTRSQDTIVALMLKEKILEIDRLVFPEKPIDVKLIEEKHEEEVPACYELNMASNGQKMFRLEKYCVFIEDLETILKELQFSFDFALMEPRLKININGEPYATLEELIFSIAVHEVRHRVQARHNIELFNPKHAYKCKDKDFARIIGRIDAASRWGLVYNDPDEFDARIIGVLALYKYRANNSYKEIIEIIKQKPPILKRDIIVRTLKSFLAI